MIQNINLGGEQRPILFGWGALYLYQTELNRNPLADFAQMMGETPSVSTMVEITYYGLKNGYATTRRDDSELTPLAVANWITETQADDPAIMEKIFNLFAASMPQADATPTANGNSKKKAALQLTGRH